MIEKALTKNPSEFLMDIIEYEKGLIEAKDAACHSISEAVK